MSLHSPSAESVPPAQVEAVIQEFEALRAALARARAVRTALLVAALLFVVGTIGLFYHFGSTLASAEYQQKLVEVGQRKLSERSELLTNEVKALADKCTPILRDAFAAQVKKDLPGLIQGVNKERDTLIADLQEHFQKMLTAHFQQVLEQQKATLKAEFPEIEDAAVHEKMTRHLGLAFDRVVKKYYVDDLKDQLVGLYDAWDHFPAADAPQQGGPPLSDQFIATLLEYLQHKITQGTPQATVAQQ